MGLAPPERLTLRALACVTPHGEFQTEGLNFQISKVIPRETVRKGLGFGEFLFVDVSPKKHAPLPIFRRVPFPNSRVLTCGSQPLGLTRRCSHLTNA